MTETALKINQLKKTYQGGTQALKGVSFEVKEGDFFALLGPNGAGKSTIIGIITGLVNKTQGSVEVYGHDLDQNPSELRSQLGIVPQEFNFNVFDKVIHTVINQAGYYGLKGEEIEKRAEHLLRKLDLWEKRDQPGRNLSGGMKRRLMLARALIHNPRLLILDEPTAGLDIELRRSLWDFLIELNQQGTTIILTTHYLEEAENLCRNIAIIDHGELLTLQSTQELLTTLQKQTLVIETQNPVDTAPSHPQFECRLLDSHRLEIDVEQGEELTSLFGWLQENQIQVQGVRNKTNRLEELFLSIIQDKKGDPS